ncbi:MAG TPA: acyl-CoA dehydrogenase family protein [Jiangellales bacterium]|nr:acyl-CoA dehydrogenase family protein [Jiangellales bacterium]
MDFDTTPEQRAFRETVRRFCDREISRDYVRECDRDHRAPVEAFKAVAGQGWLGINIAEEFGGLGGGSTEVAILLEELGRSFLDLAFWVFRCLTWGGFAIGRSGTAAQKQRFLPSIAAGDVSICFALTEPSSGSDAASIRTTAVLDGDSYVINGQKIFTSGFKVSDYVLVATRTSRGDDRHHGFTNILVDTRSAGLRSGPIETLGHWPLGTALLYFDDVRVPRDNVLGDVDQGWPQLNAYLNYERLSLSAARTGAAQSALADALEYAKTRHQFGRPIGKFQAISHKLADMAVMVELSKLMLARYTWGFDRGLNTPKDAAMLKLYTCEAYKQVADLGLQVLGGYGYTMEYDLQRHFRESRLGTIGAGTSEVQRNIIAKSMGL